MQNQLNLDLVLLHHSAKERCRSPLGALRCGQSVTIRLLTRGLSLHGVYLHLLAGVEKTAHEMHREEDGFCVTLTLPETPCVLWYYFSVFTGSDVQVFYGRNPHETSGIGKVYWEEPPAFQLTVYAKDFHVPRWFLGSAMYQIFPDRFARGKQENLQNGADFHRGMGRSVRIHASWDEKPCYLPEPGEKHYIPNDYFGGDLEGIRSALPELAAMGMEVLYLNPIFESASNHRYNTGNYRKIDPFLGTEQDFCRLAEEARQYGIRILLDGVFSHTGDDSIYFNKYGHYAGTGAYQAQDSPYFPWYRFTAFPEQYQCWWGFETLPEVDEHNADWQREMIDSEQSVMKTWLQKGASGWRLDVADELPDETIFAMRRAVKSVGDCVLMGEVWEDATTKQSYGKQRKYALGSGLDSVMNYPFRKAVLAFLTGKTDAYALRDFLIAQSQNYPPEMFFSLMNLISSHDVERAHTMLASGQNEMDLTREQQAHFLLNEQQQALGDALMKPACVLQFVWPGVSAVYYGDENGADGLKDPFNRATYQKTESELKRCLKVLGTLKRSSAALKRGYFLVSVVREDVLAVARFLADGQDYFGEEAQDAVYVAVLNRSRREQSFALDFTGDFEGVPRQAGEFLKRMTCKAGKDLLTGQSYPVQDGMLSGVVPPLSACMLKLE